MRKNKVFLLKNGYRLCFIGCGLLKSQKIHNFVRFWDAVLGRVARGGVGR